MRDLLENLNKAFDNYTRDITLFIEENKDLLEVLEIADKRGVALWHEMGALTDLYDNFNGHIKFQSEYNESIDDYLI